MLKSLKKVSVLAKVGAGISALVLILITLIITDIYGIIKEKFSPEITPQCKALINEYKQKTIFGNFQKWDLRKCNLKNLNFSNADFTHANLEYAIFEGANLDEANFSNANLKFANLNHSVLTNAKLIEADLFEAKLMNANLVNANFMSSKLSFANLDSVKLKNTNFEGATLHRTILFNTSDTLSDLFELLKYDLKQIDVANICPDSLDDPYYELRDTEMKEYCYSYESVSSKNRTETNLVSNSLFHIIILGVVEGFTEFIPVSSTGHLLLVGHFLGFQSTGNTFEVLIQLGAILALLSVYSVKLLNLILTIPSNPQSRHFVFGIFIATIPAAVIGVFAHGIIKNIFFESPALICTTLLVGGVILLFVDKLKTQPIYSDIEKFPISLCFKIGICQVVALIPGVSRSGATITGALLMKVDKRSATEFSFFLAMPTMAGAFTYDLYKNIEILKLDDFTQIAIGFVAAFIAAIFVIRFLLDFVSRHGFSLFAWWRILLGLAGFLGLYLFN